MEQAMTNCDQCGARTVDHCFDVSPDFTEVRLILETDDSADIRRPARHICGTNCLMKEVAEWADKATTAAMPASVPGQRLVREQTPWPFTLANIALS